MYKIYLTIKMGIGDEVVYDQTKVLCESENIYDIFDWIYENKKFNYDMSDIRDTRNYLEENIAWTFDKTHRHVETSEGDAYIIYEHSVCKEVF